MTSCHPWIWLVKTKTHFISHIISHFAADHLLSWLVTVLLHKSPCLLAGLKWGWFTKAGNGSKEGWTVFLLLRIMNIKSGPWTAWNILLFKTLKRMLKLFFISLKFIAQWAFSPILTFVRSNLCPDPCRIYRIYWGFNDGLSWAGVWQLFRDQRSR